jgi:DNA-directed RNA polymerase subunit F
MSQKVWYNMHGGLYLMDRRSEPALKLENLVYELGVSQLGYYLEPISDKFNFPYKIYGLESKIIKRTTTHYNSTTHGNLGILLNGLKGTGKTVTAKNICNELKQPVILISRFIEGGSAWVNTIPQNITVFVDEYEKVYEESKEFLTIMDGSMNSAFRRVFILTTNTLHIDQNLIDRPSRIRYFQTFNDLSPETVEEIVDDLLVHKNLKEDCIKFIATLKIITVDIVKSILNEVNMFNESPFEFKDIFNITVNTGTYDVVMTDLAGEFVAEFNGVACSPHTPFKSGHVRHSFYLENFTVGRITEVMKYGKFKVKLARYITKNEQGEVESRWNPYNLPEDQAEYIVEMKDHYSYNDVYSYGDDYGYGAFANKKTRRYNAKLQAVAERMEQEEGDEDEY